MLIKVIKIHLRLTCICITRALEHVDINLLNSAINSIFYRYEQIIKAQL